MSKLLVQLREQRDAKYTALVGLTDTVAAENRSELTADEDASATELRSGIEALDARIETLAADETRAAAHAARIAATPAPVATIGNEARTYRPDGEFSFFVDAISAREGDFRAAERISRHKDESRALGSGITTHLMLPTHLQPTDVKRQSTVLRAGWSQENLPDGVSEVVLPRLASSVAMEEVSTTEAQEPVEGDLDADVVSAKVYAIAGQVTVPLVVLHQTGIRNLDQIITNDLSKVADIKHDAKAQAAARAIAGHVVTCSAQTAAAFLGALGSAAALIHGSVFTPASRVVVTPARGAWLRGLTDTTGRPLFTAYAGSANVAGSLSAVQASGLIGEVMGVPVYVDPYATKDEPIVESSEETVAYTGPLFTRVLEGTDLSRKFQAYGFGANLFRDPKSIAVIKFTA